MISIGSIVIMWVKQSGINHSQMDGLLLFYPH